MEEITKREFSWKGLNGHVWGPIFQNEKVYETHSAGTEEITQGSRLWWDWGWDPSRERAPLLAAGVRPDSRPGEEWQGGAGDRGGDQSIPSTCCGSRSLSLASQGALPIGEPGLCRVFLSHLRLLLFRGDAHVLTDNAVPGRTGRKAQPMEMEQRVMQLEPREEVSPVTSKQAANGLLQGTPCHNLNQDRPRRGGRPRAAREDSKATSCSRLSLHRPPIGPRFVRQSCNVRLVACTRTLGPAS